MTDNSCPWLEICDQVDLNNHARLYQLTLNSEWDYTERQGETDEKERRARGEEGC